MFSFIQLLFYFLFFVGLLVSYFVVWYLLLWAEDDTNNGVQACKVTIAEMRDNKLMLLDQVVAKLQEELQYKQDVHNQVHQQVLPELQACGAVKDGISKCTQALQKIQVCVWFALAKWWIQSIYDDYLMCENLFVIKK